MHKQTRTIIPTSSKDFLKVIVLLVERVYKKRHVIVLYVCEKLKIKINLNWTHTIYRRASTQRHVLT